MIQLTWEEVCIGSGLKWIDPCGKQIKDSVFDQMTPEVLSKHLKGRFGPRVSNGNVFGPKEVSLGPVLVTVTVL